MPAALRRSGAADGPGSRGGGRRVCHGAPATLPAPAGGGRCGCHGTAATAAGRAAARNRCRARATSASGQGWGRAGVGGWSSQTSAPVAGESDGPSPRPERPTGLLTSSGPARAATTCSPRASRRASSRPAGAEVVLAGTADRGEALSGVGGHGSRLRGQPVSPPPPARDCLTPGGRRPERGRCRRRCRALRVYREHPAAGTAATSSHFSTTVDTESPPASFTGRSCWRAQVRPGRTGTRGETARRRGPARRLGVTTARHAGARG